MFKNRKNLVSVHWLAKNSKVNDKMLQQFHHREHYQKQPPELFCKKSCSEKIRKFHRKTPVLETLFNKVADQLY